jgi:glycosyltransferase involved in cell wall biosynthesis
MSCRMSLRITFVIPHLTLSGGHKIVFLYANELASRGHQVTIVSGALPRSSPIEVVKDLLRGRGRPKPYLPAANVRLVLAKYRDRRLVRDLPDADVLIGTWWETVESLNFAPLSKGVKCHFVQDHEVFSNLPADRTEAVYRLDLHKIVVSQWLLELMRSVYGCKTVYLIRNPVEVDDYWGVARKLADLPTVGTMYSSALRKNSEMALEVVLRAREHIPELQFVGFGVEKVPPHWSILPSTDFQVRPTRSEIANIYASADFWLFTSNSEGFGLPILEAMASGTPVIATPAGAASELVDDKTGALVGHDGDSMARAVVRLFSRGAAHWQSLSTNCRAKAESHDVTGAVEKMERILTRIAAGQSAI